MASSVRKKIPQGSFFHHTLEREQLKQLIDFIPTAIIANLSCSLIIVYGLWNYTSHLYLLIWLASTCMLAGIRLLQLYLFKTNKLWTTEPQKWISTLSLSTGLSGILWGIACYLFPPAHNLEALLLIAIVTIGMCSGTAISLNQHPKSVILFIFTSLFPLLLRFTQESYPLSGLAILSGLIYIVMLIRTLFIGQRFLIKYITSSIDAQRDKQQLANHLLHTPLAAIEWDKDFKIVSWNNAAEKTFGYSKNEAIGQHAFLLSPRKQAQAVNKAWSQLTTLREPNVGIFQSLCANGKLINCEWYSSTLQEDGVFTGAISFAQDISDRVKQEDLILHQARYDVLTNLPNRLFFKERLSQALNKTKRHNSLAALLLIDLDHFKDINDSRGHDTGDQVLQYYATLLQDHLRHCDTISRIGGDEFVVLIDDLSIDLHEAQIQLSDIANKIKHITDLPITIQDNKYHIGCSIGISLIDGSEDPELIMKRADLALYSVKNNERGNFSFYHDELATQAERHLELHNSLHIALANHEFVLFFQAKVDFTDNKIIGCEALIRWHSHTHGFVSPNEFIHLIENSSLIEDVGNWVLDEACRQVRYWSDVGLWHDDMRMAINVGARQLLAKDFPDRVNHVLNKYNLNGTNFELEITERLFIQDAELAKKNMEAVAAIGPTFAIDDFGTGYSCLSYLKSLPLHTLKVDKSFVDPLLSDQKDDTLIKTVLYICEQLQLKSVAEGIEEESQREHVEKLGCDFYQGYLHSKPMNQTSFEALLLQQQPKKT